MPAQPTTRYLTEFRWQDQFGALSDWVVPEGQLATTLTEVAHMIAEYADQEKGLVVIPADKGGTIRVTRISPDAGCMDWTEDALLHFGLQSEELTGEWPWWLADIKPAYLDEEDAA